MKIFWTKKAWRDHVDAQTMRRVDIEATNPRSIVHHKIQARAAELAVRMLVKHLDDRGVRHCWCCPSVEQLRSTPSGFACPAHAQKPANSEVTR